MTRNLISYALVGVLSTSLFAQQTSQPATPAHPTSPATQPESAQPPLGDHVLEDGTPVKLRLAKSFNSASTATGQEMEFELLDDIEVDGVTVVSKGAPAIGVFTKAEPGRSRSREGELSFRLSYLNLADGEKAPLRAAGHTRGKPNDYGYVLVMPHPPASLPVGVAAADVGAGLGVEIGTATLLALMTKGKDVSIPQGTKMTAFIDGDMHLDLAKFGAVQPAR